MDDTVYYDEYGEDPGWLSAESLFTLIVEEETDTSRLRKLKSYPLLSSLNGNTDLTVSLKGGISPSGYFGLEHSAMISSEMMQYTALMSMESDIIKMYYTMNGKTYSDRIEHRMRLNEAQEWKVQHKAGETVDSEKSHNWHIH